MRWQEVPRGHKLELGPETVAWSFDVDHIPGSIGWRVESGGMAVVFSGDTIYSRGLVEAAQGADLLIHEALATDAAHDMAVSRLHSTSGDAARVASQASVARLILTHLDNAFHENQDPLLEDASHHYAGPISASYDLMQVSRPAGLAAKLAPAYYHCFRQARFLPLPPLSGSFIPPPKIADSCHLRNFRF